MEPKLTFGTVYDCLRAVCAENGVDLADLPPSVLTEAVVSLSVLARTVAGLCTDRTACPGPETAGEDVITEEDVARVAAVLAGRSGPPVVDLRAGRVGARLGGHGAT